jgi:hypothetical protein
MSLQGVRMVLTTHRRGGSSNPSLSSPPVQVVLVALSGLLMGRLHFPWNDRERRMWRDAERIYLGFLSSIEKEDDTYMLGAL